MEFDEPMEFQQFGDDGPRERPSLPPLGDLNTGKPVVMITAELWGNTATGVVTPKVCFNIANPRMQETTDGVMCACVDMSPQAVVRFIRDITVTLTALLDKIPDEPK